MSFLSASVFLGEHNRSRPQLKARHISITLALPRLVSIEDYGATTPPPLPQPMITPGSRAMAIGFTVMLLCVSSGMHSGTGGFGLLLCFMGVLAGTKLVAVGVRMTHNAAPTFPAAFGGARALATFVRRNNAVVGVLMASCAVMMVSGKPKPEPFLCFGMLAVLLLAVSLINIGVRGE